MKRQIEGGGCGGRLLFVYVLIALVSFSSVYGELIQVQVVHRHGARTHLRKDGRNPGIENGASLLPQGVSQLNSLGDAVRNRYLTSGKLNGASVNYSEPLDILSVSSNLDRTLGSARAFLFGLYPAQHELIPTKVFGAKENDYRLRGYAICPAYTSNVRTFLESREFRDKERDNAAFLKRIAAPLEESDDLKDVFNVYDRYALLRLGHNEDARGVTPLNESDWNRLRDLADWTESHKHSHKLSVGRGAAPGSALLGTMVKYTRAAIAGNLASTHRMISYSAHYPTLLTLLAAAHTKHSAGARQDVIPRFGSALLWEVHRDASNRIQIHTYWRLGKKLGEVSILPCGEARCDFETVVQDLGSRANADVGQFCSACKTSAKTSPICGAGVVPWHISDNGASTATSAVSRRVCNGLALRSGAVGAALGSSIVLAAWGLAVVFASRRRARAERAAQLAAALEAPDEDPGWSGMYPKYEGVVQDSGAGSSSGNTRSTG